MRGGRRGLLRALGPCSIWLAIAGGAAGARAALIETDLDPGDGRLTEDTDTGLVWLDVTATISLSYDEVEANEGGWIALGFRHASFAEICDLLVSEGIPSGTCQFQPPQFIDAPDSTDDGDIQRVVQLQALFGVTGGGGPGDSQKNTDGLYDDGGGLDPNMVGNAGLRVLVPATEVRLRVDGDSRPRDESDPVQPRGHWLVRAPEPAQGWLFATALGAVAAARRWVARG